MRLSRNRIHILVFGNLVEQHCYAASASKLLEDESLTWNSDFCRDQVITPVFAVYGQGSRRLKGCTFTATVSVARHIDEIASVASHHGPDVLTAHTSLLRRALATLDPA